VKTLGIDIAGCGVRFASADGALGDFSPAYAVQDRNAWITGEPARSQAWILPRLRETVFWDHLSVEPSAPGGTNLAELAFFHLEQQLKSSGFSSPPDTCVMAVPDHWSESQYALLAGICEELRLPLVAISKRSATLALHAQSQLTNSIGAEKKELEWVLSLQQHQITLSHIESGSRGIRVKRSTSLPRHGWFDLRNIVAKALAQEFISKTRFDPFHRAESEQTLMNRLSLTPSIFDLSTVECGGQTIQIAPDFWVNALGEFSADIASWLMPQIGLEATLILSESDKALSHILKQPTYLVEDACVAIDCAKRASSPEFQAGTVTQIQWVAPLKEPSEAHAGTPDDSLISSQQASSPDEHPIRQTSPMGSELSMLSHIDPDLPPPTHVIYRGQAWAIGEIPLTVGREGRLQITENLVGVSRQHCMLHRSETGTILLTDRSSYGTAYQGLLITEPTDVQAGGLIRIGDPGEVLLLITEVCDGA